MYRRHFVMTCAIAAVSATLGATSGQSQDSTLRLVVGYPPGGSSDRVARIVAERLQQALGTPVIVENKVGAGGRVSAQYVKNAPASQPMLLLANPAVMVVSPLVVKDLGYAAKDFVPVSEVNNYVFGLAVPASAPIATLKDLLAWLPAHPQQANIGVPATGSLPHFFALMLAQQAKVAAEVIGYKGSAPLLNDLLGGQIPVAVDTLDVLLPQHQAGKLRLLGVSSASRHPLAADVPTLTDGGVALTADGFNTLFAPTSMPPAQVQRYAALIAQIMQQPTTQQQFQASSLDPVVTTAEQAGRRLQAYRQQWEPVINASGYQP